MRQMRMPQHDPVTLLDLPMGGGWALRVQHCRGCWSQPYRAIVRTPTRPWEIFCFASSLEALLRDIDREFREIRRIRLRSDDESREPAGGASAAMTVQSSSNYDRDRDHTPKEADHTNANTDTDTKTDTRAQGSSAAAV